MKQEYANFEYILETDLASAVRTATEAALKCFSQMRLFHIEITNIPPLSDLKAFLFSQLPGEGIFHRFYELRETSIKNYSDNCRKI